MNKLLYIFFIATLPATAQEYSASSIFAHNDYSQSIPFHSAYSHHVGFIEADIFLNNGKLLVAHTEVNEQRTLEKLYLQPLQHVITKNNGSVYESVNTSLTLMIDVKTDGLKTVKELVNVLNQYPQLTTCPTLHITISGNVPAPQHWKELPTYITFDGRPGISYTEDQLQRVQLISDSFSKYATWNGKGKIIKSELDKILAVRDHVHALGKKIRFWGTPDVSNAWMTFMQLRIDVLNTDHVPELAEYILLKPSRSYTHATPHKVYTPQHSFTKTRHPKNIILLIGDGMGLAQLYAGYTANRGALSIFNIPTTGLSITTAADHYITDSAAGATAMATGQKTNNRFIGMDSTKKTIPPITQTLDALGYQTILISNGDITDATPAAFYAHQPERSMSEAIAADLIKSNIDIVVGANPDAFTNRKDGTDLFLFLRQKGYVVSTHLAALDTITRSKFVVLDNQAGKRKTQGRGDFLAHAFHSALRVTQPTTQPFFMMAEGAQIDWGGHANELPYVVTEVLDFDQLVGAALQFADTNKETLVIITADHETGGLALTGGDLSTGSIEGTFGTVDHTAVAVPVFAYGPGAEMFSGVYQNTEIFKKIKQLLVAKTAAN